MSAFLISLLLSPAWASGTDEACDGIDNDGDGIIDEPMAVLPDDFDTTNGMWHHIDLDQDGYGDGSRWEGENGTLFICNAFEAYGDEATACNANENGEPGIGSRSHGHLIDGDCYVPNADDCADTDVSVHPVAPSDHIEFLDGRNNDCDDYMPLIELDCDGDGAFAAPGLFQGLAATDVDQLIGSYGRTHPLMFSSAEDLGLAACTPGSVFPVPEFSCWGSDTPLQLLCDAHTGLWMVALATISDSGLWDGHQPSFQAGDAACTSSSYWDCDDRNARRCLGDDVEEVCDGIDNDCNRFHELLTPDTDGVPDAFTLPSGFVQAAELDRDGDQVVTCDSPALGDDEQVWPTWRLEPLEADDIEPSGGRGGDCNDTCSLASPLADSEVCNGFLTSDTCGGAPEADADLDGFAACGAHGPAADAEVIYATAFVAGDAHALSSVNPATFEGVDTVVPLVVPRRHLGEGFKGTDGHMQIRSCDLGLQGALEDLGLDLPPPTGNDYEDATREAFLDLCVRASTCGEYAKLLAAGHDLNEVLDDEGAIVMAHEGQAPAPSHAGDLGMPDYCTGFVDETGTITGQCVTLEITLSRDGSFAADDDLYDPRDFNGLVGGAHCLYDTESGTPDDAEPAEVLQNAEQLISRSVWSRDQIVQSRKLVVERECFRLDGTFGCEVGVYDHTSASFGTWRSPFRTGSTSGHFPMGELAVDDSLWQFDGRNKAALGDPDAYDVDDTISADWWPWLGRYPVRQVRDETLYGCWGDPTLAGIDDDAMTLDLVGGDCHDDADVTAHREVPEGPDDLLALYLGLDVACRTCRDDLDNNCDGLTDADDPGCAPCRSPLSCSTAAPVQALWLAPLLLIGLRRRRD